MYAAQYFEYTFLCKVKFADDVSNVFVSFCFFEKNGLIDYFRLSEYIQEAPCGSSDTILNTGFLS